MDYQNLVDTVSLPCCVLSVEETKTGGCGEIRIVCANRAYREVMGSAYYDNMRYQEMVPRESRFEEHCFQAAVLKRPVHTYLEVPFLNGWLDETLIPLESGRENLHYCQFIFEMTSSTDAKRMSYVPIHVAQTVIEASVMLMVADDVRSGISDALQVLLEAAEAEAAYIALIDHEHKQTVISCECNAPDSGRIDKKRTIPYELIQSWEGMVNPCNSLLFKDEQDLETVRNRNPALYEALRSRQISSLMLVPIQSAGSVIGYLHVVNFAAERVVEIAQIVELVSFFIGTELCNQLLLDKLDVLSHTDALTGASNRHAMMERVRKLDQDGANIPYGVISIDLNGLKVVNDQMGHEAGDQLLIQAAELLRKVFHQDDLFRTGGDEFVVIQRDIGKRDFEKLLLRLRDSLSVQDRVSLSMGLFWSNGLDDAASALRTADKRMYAAKKAFYQEHPELRRK